MDSLLRQPRSLLRLPGWEAAESLLASNRPYQNLLAFEFWTNWTEQVKVAANMARPVRMSRSPGRLVALAALAIMCLTSAAEGAHGNLVLDLGACSCRQHEHAAVRRAAKL